MRDPLWWWNCPSPRTAPPAGSTTVNAIGANPDGSIVILDPNSSYGNSSLATYLNGFSAAGHIVQGTISAVIQIVPSFSMPAGFVAASPIVANASASSAAGTCPAVDLADPANAGQTVPVRVGGVRFIACDGTLFSAAKNASYQLSFANQTGSTVYDLGGGSPVSIPASSAAAYQVTRNGSVLALTPQTLTSFLPWLTRPASYLVFLREAFSPSSALASPPARPRRQLPPAACPSR